MAIDWNSLRSWNGSVAKAFEELCCQLAAAESVVPDARFYRKGTPDAGVECFWVLPDGTEWAWQAKWFRSSPGPTQWAELDESVSYAIEKHPRLTRYTVCIPIDRSDARIPKQKSFLQKWHDRVKKWESAAAKHSMKVSFDYWGESEIGLRLSNEQHQGRHWFWFGTDSFTREWFRLRTREALANAGGRYSPELNVDLPVRQYFDAMGRTPAFFGHVAEMYEELSIAVGKLSGISQSHSELRLGSIRARTGDTLQILRPWTSAEVGSGRPYSPDEMVWSELERALRGVVHDTRALISDLEDRLRDEDTDPIVERRISRALVHPSIYRLQEFVGSASRLLHFCRSSIARLSNDPALLLVGEAGQGKTHLLCRVAETDVESGHPRLLLHGEQFRDDEPWMQIIRQLGLTCSRDVFIGALEAAAQASGSRLLILIDALNEGEGKRLWSKFLPGVLTLIKRSPWLGLGLSVRDTYLDLVVPRDVQESHLTSVSHSGFAEAADDAMEKFFDHYGIEPSTPLLMPEFNNPLFLKLYCQSIKNSGLSRAPEGLRGISSLLAYYVKSLDKKLSRPDYLDFDPRRSITAEAIDRLTDQMAKDMSEFIPLDTARYLVDSLLPQEGYDKSLFRHLESEGLLAVVPTYRGGGTQWSDAVRFTYQRFSDHLVVEKLLTTHLNPSEPTEAFSKRRKLGRLFKDERECIRRRGLFEAMSIQLPERTGQELHELAPHLTDLHATRNAFVEGLVWRDAGSFTPATFRYINDHVLRYRGTADSFWNAQITLAAAPGHPLNAERLHKSLSKLSLAARDRIWTTFLQREWGNERALNRLVRWAWDSEGKSAFSDEVVRLAGIALTWLFTSSNRFLRDRATKAAVSLLAKRLNVLRAILKEFATVNDPYVMERLLAVAYGSAMRTTDCGGLERVAQDVFEMVFAEGTPPPHVLLRDYARGVIEIASQQCPTLQLDPQAYRPPYRSEWPGLEIPSAEEVRAIAEWEAGMPDARWALVQLHDSVMEEDFSRYVLGSFDRWTDQRVNEPVKCTRRQVYDGFMRSLTPRQREAVETYEAAVTNARFRKRLGPQRQEEYFGNQFSQDELEPVLDHLDCVVASRLRRNSTKHAIFQNYVKDYIADPDRFYGEFAFDGQLARRWILQRVFDLGWSSEYFSEFDRSVGSKGRDPDKPERIGKKYQWIAYHELVGRLADNFRMRTDNYSVRSEFYETPGDAGVFRDIDPSNLLRETPRDRWTAYTNTWWFPVRFDEWREPLDESEWTRRTDPLPDGRQLIRVAEPDTRTEWLCLHGYYHWEEPVPPGIERQSARRREISYLLKCYLFKAKDYRVLSRWAKKQNWTGRWMPESSASHQVFLGEFFRSPAFDAESPGFPRHHWIRASDGRPPVEVLVADDDYMWESGGYDCSLDETLSVDLPSAFLVDGMQLNWRGQEGMWFNEDGRVVAFDPSVREAGPSCLLVRQDELLQFLQKNDLSLFWTLFGEKWAIGGPSQRDDYTGRLDISGAYFLKANSLVGELRTDFEAPRG